MTMAVYHTVSRNVPLYRLSALDAVPDLIYGIFTRQGGVSQPPYASLNLGASVGDDPQAVAQNFERACGALGITPEETVSCHLAHSRRVLSVNRANRRRVMPGQVDGLLTAERGVYLAMRFGDCTPLIVYDPVQGVVGLSHAGWRGTVRNIAGATVRAMVREYGSRPGDMMAVIGPAIGPCCYEVGPEVVRAAAQIFRAPGELFQPNGRPGHAQFDMGAANRQQLLEAGLTNIITMNLCTACHTDLFFSHRAERGSTGRFGVIIGRPA